MTDFHGAEQSMIDDWVMSTLVTYFTANASINNGLKDRIFDTLAAPDTAFPYIVFQVQSPANVVRGVGDAEVMVDTLYIVKGVAQGPNYSALAPIASAIRTAMTKPNGENITGGAVFTSRYETQHALTETEDSKQFRQLGGLFRIQAQAA